MTDEAPIDPRFVAPEDLTEKDLLHALWKDVRTIRLIAQIFFVVWLISIVVAFVAGALTVAGVANS